MKLPSPVLVYAVDRLGGDPLKVFGWENFQVTIHPSPTKSMAILQPLSLQQPTKSFPNFNPKTRLQSIALKSIEYYIFGQARGVCIAERFIHRFKRPVALMIESGPDRPFCLKASGRMFSEHDLGDLLSETKFKGLTGLQFVA